MEADAYPAAFLGEETEANITLRNQLESPLLRLPAELRNKIYTHVGLSTTIEVIVIANHMPQAKDWGSAKLKVGLPGLLSTCKQIRQEATSLIGKSAILDLSKIDPRSWLEPRCKNKFSELITSVRIDYEFAEVASGVSSLYLGQTIRAKTSPTSWLPSLEKVHVKSWGWRPFEDSEKIKSGLRLWCKQDNLKVIFEDLLYWRDGNGTKYWAGEWKEDYD
ncbi:uncharacterized protein J4E79_006463 [Alternaria viburni]|uniref:uncharacterized protein n=1 Tax=Alternaria viburni TaxID=566460 RepID=UPI0020C4989B|nr:uncharacterized protein J4E79_006463 [Alternaria viburni]KAI4658705.1 hypothetical protein J4E79_006463 [Alternaria viburni]